MANPTPDNPAHPQSIVIAPTSQHTATVIFVHGLGQTNENWVPVLRRIMDLHPGVKWILPQAPEMPVSCSNRRIRPSWFDIAHLPPCNHYDEAGASASIARLEDLILTQVRQGPVPESRIVLAGFSQGASLSLMTALTTLHELGGVASLSGWIPQECRQTMKQIEPNLPVFWSHGAADNEVPVTYGEEGSGFLQRCLHIPEDKMVFKIYDGLGHDINDAVLDDFSEWLSNILRFSP